MIKRSFRAVPALLAVLALLYAVAPQAALADDPSTPVDTTPALTAAISDPTVTDITLDASVQLTLDFPAGKTLRLNGNTLSLSAAYLEIAGAIVGGGTLNASLDACVTGSIASNVTVTGILRQTFTTSGLPISKVSYSDGSYETFDPASTAPWVIYRENGTSVSVTGFVANGVAYRYGSSTGSGGGFLPQYTVSYVFLGEDKKAITLPGGYTNSFPTNYTAGDAQFKLVDPKISGYTFQGWIIDNTLVSEYVVNPATLGNVNVTFTAYLTAASGAGNTGKAGVGGNVAGGGTGTFSAAAATLTTDDDDDDDAATATVATTVSTRGQRVRTATSTTRHTINTTEETDIEALASARARRKTFPWQWVGAGVGGAAVLTALLFTVRRRRAEKYAETLEKLRIYE